MIKWQLSTAERIAIAAIMVPLIPASIAGLWTLYRHLNAQTDAHAVVNSKSFRNPSLDGIRVDYCLERGTYCGFDAANSFCELKGFDIAKYFDIDKDIGKTWILGDKSLCLTNTCDGFKFIQCVRNP